MRESAGEMLNVCDWRLNPTRVLDRISSQINKLLDGSTTGILIITIAQTSGLELDQDTRRK